MYQVQKGEIVPGTKAKDCTWYKKQPHPLTAIEFTLLLK